MFVCKKNVLTRLNSHYGFPGKEGKKHGHFVQFISKNLAVDSINKSLEEEKLWSSSLTCKAT